MSIRPSPIRTSYNPWLTEYNRQLQKSIQKALEKQDPGTPGDVISESDAASLRKQLDELARQVKSENAESEKREELEAQKVEKLTNALKEETDERRQFGDLFTSNLKKEIKNRSDNYDTVENLKKEIQNRSEKLIEDEDRSKGLIKRATEDALKELFSDSSLGNMQTRIEEINKKLATIREEQGSLETKYDERFLEAKNSSNALVERAVQDALKELFSAYRPYNSNYPEVPSEKAPAYEAEDDLKGFVKEAVQDALKELLKDSSSVVMQTWVEDIVEHKIEAMDDISDKTSESSSDESDDNDPTVKDRVDAIEGNISS